MVGQLKIIKKFISCKFLFSLNQDRPSELASILEERCNRHVAGSHATPRSFKCSNQIYGSVSLWNGISIGLTTKHGIYIYLCHLKGLSVHFRWQHAYVVPSCTWLQGKTQLPMKPLHQHRNGRKFATDAYCQRYKCVVNYHSYRECI